MELVFEIGCEEIPAGFIGPALEQMEKLAREKLEAERLSFESIKTLGTPRRLAMIVSGLPEKQDDIVEERIGPSKKVAFDDDDKPTKAAMGFAKGAGVNANALYIKTTEKGEYIAAEVKIKGKHSKEVLSEMLPQIISSINFRKSMRWGEGAKDVRFARPIHWILAVADGEVVPFEFAGIQSGSATRGHRFKHPEEIKISSADDYISKLRDANVIVDIDERRIEIKKGIEDAAKSLNAGIAAPESLIEEVVNLVEHPTIVIGSFPKEFLEIPEPVIVTAMTEHQRYFPLKKDGKLIPNFITVAGTPVKDIALVAKGNERVLKARLSDAQFFYNEDRKVEFDKTVEDLKNVVFQAKIGSYYDKVQRVRELAGFIAEKLAPDDPSVKEAAMKAALLSKADLTTHMVGEFPSLQGVMGGVYARSQGLPEAVARAIEEHYLPKSNADIEAGNLPETIPGCCVAIADRFDTLVSCFDVGLAPTAEKDPYALRRAALGVIAIILNKEFHIKLYDIHEKARNIYGRTRENKGSDTGWNIFSKFIWKRLEILFNSRGYPYDVVRAVLNAGLQDYDLVSKVIETIEDPENGDSRTKSIIRMGYDDIVDVKKRIKALSDLKKTPEFEPLMTSFKRVGNIIKDFDGKNVDENLLKEPEEKKLYKEFQNIDKRVDEHVENRQFNAALKEMMTLKPHVDTFFDEVLVMCKDEALKENRLSLLTNIRDMFLNVADFSAIVVEGKAEVPITSTHK